MKTKTGAKSNVCPEQISIIAGLHFPFLHSLNFREKPISGYNNFKISLLFAEEEGLSFFFRSGFFLLLFESLGKRWESNPEYQPLDRLCNPCLSGVGTTSDPPLSLSIRGGHNFCYSAIPVYQGWAQHLFLRYPFLSVVGTTCVPIYACLSGVGPTSVPPLSLSISGGHNLCSYICFPFQ